MSQKIRKAVIPAAGFGTRFLPITKSIPKEMLPIGNKPAIQYVVEEAVEAGVEEIILVCHPHKTAIIDYFKPDPAFRAFLEKKGKKKEAQELSRVESLATFLVAYQEEPLGLGHAVWSARKLVGDEPFLVMLPDVLVEGGDTKRLIEACGEGDWGILLEKVPPERVSSYGIIRCEEAGEGLVEVRGAVEKPEPKKAPSNLAILGRYLFMPNIFPLIERSSRGVLGEVQLTDALNALALEKSGQGIVVKGKTFDVGMPEGLMQAGQYFASVRP